jgi:hypothetical protein
VEVSLSEDGTGKPALNCLSNKVGILHEEICICGCCSVR